MSEENKEQTVIPSADEVQREMIERELAAQKAEGNPLDAHAQLFFLYNPRLVGQTNFMSKKQLILLMQTIVGSEYNTKDKVAEMTRVADGINLKGLRRVITSVVEHPLNEDKINLMSDKEKKLFHLFDELIINKYYNCIKVGLEKKREDDDSIKQIEDVVLHTHDTKKFQKRKQVEKDAFATANKLLASKCLMILVTTMEYMLETAEEVKDFNVETKV